MSNKKLQVLFLVSMFGIILVPLFSNHVVPLYDGVGFPDEPYRYVSAPPGVKNSTLSPSPASATVLLSNGTNQNDISFSSREQGPQVNIYIYGFALKSSINETKISLNSNPKSAKNTVTPKGNIAGNVYAFGYETKNGSISIKSDTNEQRGYIDLRLPQINGAYAIMAFRPLGSQKWQILKTEKVGNDIYQSAVPGFGDYGLVAAKPDKAPDPYTIRMRIIYICLAILLVLCTVLIVLRSRNRKALKKKTK
jgi:hypothetical protein